MVVGEKVDVLECRLDVEYAVFDEDVLISRRCLFELAVSKATHFDLFRPYVRVQRSRSEVIFVYHTVFVLGNASNAKEDVHSGNDQAQDYAQQWKHAQPSLPGIFFLLEPRPIGELLIDPA